MAASPPIRLLSTPSSPWLPQDPSPRPVPSVHASPPRHRHLRAARCALSPPPPSLDLPLLPFQPAEVRYFGYDSCLVVQISVKPDSLVCHCQRWCWLFWGVNVPFHGVQSVGPWKVKKWTTEPTSSTICIGCTARYVSFVMTEHFSLIWDFYGNYIGPIWSAGLNDKLRYCREAYKPKQLHYRQVRQWARQQPASEEGRGLQNRRTPDDSMQNLAFFISKAVAYILFPNLFWQRTASVSKSCLKTNILAFPDINFGE